MMKIHLLLFASIREKVGASELDVELEGDTVQHVIDLLVGRFPQIEPLLKRAHIALNEEYCDKTSKLKNGDVIAMIPPVSGG